MPTLTPDDWRTILTAIAIVVSGASLLISLRSWRQAHRPFICCDLQTQVGGGDASPYNLTIANTGTRPAANVTLTVDRASILSATSSWVQADEGAKRTLSTIFRCFSPEGEIGLLANGRTVTNSFGSVSKDPSKSFWRHGASISVFVAYRDLEGRSYAAKQTLRIKEPTGLWKEYGPLQAATVERGYRQGLTVARAAGDRRHNPSLTRRN